MAVQRVGTQRERVFQFIQAEVARCGRFPSATAIRNHMGWKTTQGVSDCMTALVCDRKLRVKSRTPSGRSFRYEYEIADGQ